MTFKKRISCSCTLSMDKSVFQYLNVLAKSIKNVLDKGLNEIVTVDK